MIDEEAVKEIAFVAAGAATGVLLRDHPNYIFPSERVTEAVRLVLESYGIGIDLD